MSKPRVVLCKVALALTSLGLGVIFLSTGSAYPVFAEEIVESQASEQNLVTLRDQVLEKLRGLVGGSEADQSFYYRVGLEQDGQLPVYVDADTVLQKIQLEDFRMDLIEEARIRANQLYAEQGLDRIDQFGELYTYQPSTSSSAIRYGFAEATLSLSDLYGHQFTSLVNPYSSDENELIRSKQSVLQHLQDYIPQVTAILELQAAYNRVIKLFNEQPESERKAEFEAYADEMVRKLSTSLYRVDWSDKEATLTEIQRLETRISETLLTPAQHEQAKKELAALSHQYVTDIQNLEQIDSSTDWGYNQQAQTDLEQAKTLEEANQILAQSRNSWNFFYRKLQKINQILGKVNELEKSLGGEGDRKFILPSQYGWPATAQPEKPTMGVAVVSGDEFLVQEEEVRKRSYLLWSQMWDYFYSSSEEEFIKYQTRLEQGLLLEEKKIEVERELIAAYNKRARTINTLPVALRHKIWLKLIYPREFYVLDAIHLLGKDWTSLEEVEEHRQKVLTWLQEFDQLLPNTDASYISPEDTLLPSETPAVNPSSENSLTTSTVLEVPSASQTSEMSSPSSVTSETPSESQSPSLVLSPTEEVMSPSPSPLVAVTPAPVGVTSANTDFVTVKEEGGASLLDKSGEQAGEASDSNQSKPSQEVVNQSNQETLVEQYLLASTVSQASEISSSASVTSETPSESQSPSLVLSPTEEVTSPLPLPLAAVILAPVGVTSANTNLVTVKEEGGASLLDKSGEKVGEANDSNQSKPSQEVVNQSNQETLVEQSLLPSTATRTVPSTAQSQKNLLGHIASKKILPKTGYSSTKWAVLSGVALFGIVIFSFQVERKKGHHRSL